MLTVEKNNAPLDLGLRNRFHKNISEHIPLLSDSRTEPNSVVKNPIAPPNRVAAEISRKHQSDVGFSEDSIQTITNELLKHIENGTLVDPLKKIFLGKANAIAKSSLENKEIIQNHLREARRKMPTHDKQIGDFLTFIRF